ncbi:MAG: hypothetical protein C4296_05615 [Gemmataceae bacterium]
MSPYTLTYLLLGWAVTTVPQSALDSWRQVAELTKDRSYAFTTTWKDTSTNADGQVVQKGSGEKVVLEKRLGNTRWLTHSKEKLTVWESGKTTEHMDEAVGGLNPKYIFSLRKARDGNKLRLEKCHAFDSQDRQYLAFGRTAHPLLDIKGDSLLVLCQSAFVRVTGIEPVTYEGRRCYALDLAVTPWKGKLNLTEMLSAGHGFGFDRARCIVDPEHYWMIREYELVIETPTRKTVRTRKWRVEVDGRSGMLVPKGWVETNKSTAKPGAGKEDPFPALIIGEQEGVVTEFSLEPPRPEEFTLSAFGIAEPEWAVEPRRIPWALLLLVPGLVLVALALWLLRRRMSGRENHGPRAMPSGAHGK